MKRGTEILWIALLAFSAATTSVIAAPQPVQAVVDQPRAFGYVVGDLVTQRVLLNFEPAALPPGQRVSIWFERRPPRIEKSSDGRRWLVIDYQVINAPPEPSTVQLPAWEINDKTHGAQLKVPAAPISITPLISTASSAELRPDRDVSIIDTAPSRANVVLWAIALGVTLAAWLAWSQWRNWLDSHNQPFARALRQLRHLDEKAPEAWQAVHRAFDQTAGRVLQIDTLPALFERAPHLQPQRAEIERFFAQSNERFFGAGSASNLVSVRALCQELSRIERRHAQ